jgi:hypothetical protein
MHNKIITLPVIFVLFFSLQGFCQTNEKSAHPLLDKYYPHASVDTNKAITTQIKVAPETKTAPVQTIAPVTSTPVAITPVMTTPLTTDLTTVPVTTTPAVTTTHSVTTIPDVTTVAPVTTSTAINKPTAVTPLLPVQKNVQSQAPPSPPYIDTRLGSSTKAYDTWEKNNNGAGSVTTSPK